MKQTILKNCSPQTLKLIRRIGAIADQLNIPGYIVGGSVRDILLKRENVDIDFVFVGNPLAVVRKYLARSKEPYKYHQQFQTAAVFLADGRRLDFARARKEHYSYNGALPVVQPGDIKEDISRRDFTINALAVRINHAHFGELLDLCGGLNDLKEKKIRVLHNDSFLDDPTRILRAIRFEQRFKFTIEPKTKRSMRAAIDQNALTWIKLPRYFNEFKKGLNEPSPYAFLKRLDQQGCLGLGGNEKNIRWPAVKRLETGIGKLKKCIPYKEYGDWWLMYLMAILVNGEINSTIKVLNDFQLTKEDRAAIIEARSQNEFLTKLSSAGLTNDKIYALLSPLSRGVIYYLRAQGGAGRSAKYIDRFVKSLASVQLLVNGHEIKALGFNERQIGDVMRELLLRKVNGSLITKKDEIDYARHILTGKSKE